jgi:hypothetical protein
VRRKVTTPEGEMRPPIRLPELSPEAIVDLDELYRTTHDIRFWVRAHMILLAAEQHMIAPEIAKIMRCDEQMVRPWPERYLAEGIKGLADMPRPGPPGKVTAEYRRSPIPTPSTGSAEDG